MPRGYRDIILAALIVPVIGAAPPKREDSASVQQHRQRPIADALNNIQATLQKPTERDVTAGPCSKGETHRYSDLCAQWQAADAAASAALAAWVFGGLGSLIGGATLAAAIQAARYAKRAADETKRSADIADRMSENATSAISVAVDANNITSDISHKQLRAYMSVDKVLADDGTNAPERTKLLLGTPGSVVTVKNYGQTPARNVLHASRIFIGPAGEVFGFSGEPPAGYRTSIAPGQESTASKVAPYKTTAEEARDLRAGLKSLYIVGRVDYEDIFGMPHRTTYCLHLTGKWPPPKDAILDFSEGGNETT